MPGEYPTTLNGFLTRIGEAVLEASGSTEQKPDSENIKEGKKWCQNNKSVLQKLKAAASKTAGAENPGASFLAEIKKFRNDLSKIEPEGFYQLLEYYCRDLSPAALKEFLQKVLMKLV